MQLFLTNHFTKLIRSTSKSITFGLSCKDSSYSYFFYSKILDDILRYGMTSQDTD